MRKALIIQLGLCFGLALFGTVAAQGDGERCANNKKQIAEYEGQVRVLKLIASASQLSYARDIASKLSDAITMNKLLPDYTSSDARVALLYSMNVPLAEADDQKRFQLVARNRIYALIDEIKAQGFAARAERAAGLEQQIAIHKNRLLDLKCDELEKPVDSCTIEGKWQQTYGSVWTVTADGTATEAGLGAATGTASLSGTTMTIEWSHKNGWSGTYRWVMDKECKTGKGKLIFKSGGQGERESNVTHTPPTRPG